MAEKRIRTSAGRETASQTVARIKSSLGSSATSSRSSRPNESVDQTVSRANAMLAQTKAEGSKSFAGSTFEKAYTDSIGTKQVTQNPLISLPDKPVPAPVGDIIGANNAVLAPGLGATTDSKGFVSTPVKDSNDQSGFQSIFQQYMSSLEAPPSTESIYRKAPELRERNQAQQEVNTAQAELNNIIAKRDADVLSVVGQGRGIPEAIIGGQQAQLEREAAIRALPIQAKLAAAQGNLEMAQSNLNTMMQLRIQDAQMQYQFKTKMLDTVYNFANGQEQRRVDAMKVAEQRKFEVEQNFIKTQTGVMSDALANGAPTSVITAIQNAKTPQEALAAAGEYIGKLDRQIKRAQLDKINREISTLGEKTEEEKKEEAIAIKQAEASADIAKGKIDLIDALKKHKGMAGTVGAYGLARWTPFSVDKAEQRDFIGSVDSLTNGLTLDNLIEAKARGATFGALTQEELRLLANSATKINSWRLTNNGRTIGYEAGEDEFVTELNNIQRLTRKALVESGEQLLDATEAGLLDSVFGGMSQFDPSAYFSTPSGT